MVLLDIVGEAYLLHYQVYCTLWAARPGYARATRLQTKRTPVRRFALCGGMRDRRLQRFATFFIQDSFGQCPSSVATLGLDNVMRLRSKTLKASEVIKCVTAEYNDLAELTNAFAYVSADVSVEKDGIIVRPLFTCNRLTYTSACLHARLGQFGQSVFITALIRLLQELFSSYLGTSVKKNPWRTVGTLGRCAARLVHRSTRLP
jgi:hypothetical protein